MDGNPLLDILALSWARLGRGFLMGERACGVASVRALRRFACHEAYR